MAETAEPAQPAGQPAGQLAGGDLDYVRAEYADLATLCADREETPEQVRALVADGSLPRPAYVLADGTEMYPPDYFVLDAVGGADGVTGLRSAFEERYRITTATMGVPEVELEEDWKRWLSGEAGASLSEFTPEAMAERSALVGQVKGLVAAPKPDDPQWVSQVREAVEELDELLRPGTDHDRERWGQLDRDTYVDQVRAAYL